VTCYKSQRNVQEFLAIMEGVFNEMFDVLYDRRK